MAPSQRRFKVVADVFVELSVLFVAHLLFGASPKGVGLVDGFPLVGQHHFAGLATTGGVTFNEFSIFPLLFAHADGQRNVVRVFVDDRLELPGAQVFLGIVTQVQDDLGAALRLGDGFYVEVTGASAAPTHTFFGFQSCAAGLDGDAVRHDVTRIKAHAELTNQSALVFGVGFLVATELAHELACAALGNGAQMGDGFFLAHANAVVGNGQRLGVFVKAHADFELGIAFKQGIVVQAFITQFVAGVRGVGHQLTQEDFFVRIQRVRDKVQELRDFGLEGMGLFGHGLQKLNYKKRRPKLWGINLNFKRNKKGLNNVFRTFHAAPNTATAPLANYPIPRGPCGCA